MATLPAPLDLFSVTHPRADADGFLAPFRDPAFGKLPTHTRFNRVNRALLDWVLAQSEPCFLLVPFTELIAKVSALGVLDSRLNQTGFEAWLNRDSGVDETTNQTVRSRLVGAKIPRDAYHWAFPVSGGRLHLGSHTVTAHNPPDIDTTTASFWSWVDAFACRVGTSLHVWNLPGGRPGEDVSFLFDTLLTPHVFQHVAKDRRHIAHEAIDILTRDRFILAKGATNLTTLRHNRYENAIVLVDEEGYFVGDWRLGDVDAVGRIRRTLTGTLREYLRQVTTRLTEVFSAENPRRADASGAIQNLLERPFYSPGEQTEDQIELDALLLHIFDLPQGTATPLTVTLARFDESTGASFAAYLKALDELIGGDLWDGDGRLQAPVPRVFRAFARVHETLAAAVRAVGSHTLRMDVVMAIKHEVVGHRPHVVTTRATVEEIREKIGSYEHITVVFPAKNGKLLPVGTIHASDLERPVQGTVSLRDFANGGEIGLAAHLEIISVVDHHRIDVKTRVAPAILVGDVQSSNTLLALQAFARFDAHSLRGQSPAAVEAQLAETLARPGPASVALARRLLAKKEVISRAEGTWVHPLRERLEYTFYLHAILDDTDLLVKAGWRDLDVVAELLSRLRGLEEGREIPLVDFGMDRSPAAIPHARRLLLRHDDLYGFYRRVGAMKAQWVDRHLSSPDPGPLFEDTKIQSGRYSVGQTKLYPDNRAAFARERSRLMGAWLRRVAEVRQTQPQVDLFFHMVSTVHGPEESYHDRPIDKSLRDEIWIRFDRGNDQAASLFRLFLARWRTHPKLRDVDLRSSAEGGDGGERGRLTHILGEVFLENPVVDDGDRNLAEGVAVLRFQAGTLNSRKADLTPYLPKPGGP